MSKFNELYVKGTAEELEKFKKAASNFSDNGWIFRTDSFNGWEYLFFRKEEYDIEASLLYKTEKKAYYVPNIVPIQRQEISPQEYNDYLDRFKQEVVDSIINAHHDIRVEVEIERG